jgi:alanyl-tRNA synthetase
MKIDISNTTRKLNNLTQINSNLDYFKANAISPKKSKKIYRTIDTSKLKKKIPEDVSMQINFDVDEVNKFNEKEKSENKEINLNTKADIQNINLVADNILNNINNKSMNLLGSKVNYERELQNSSIFENIKELNNSSIKLKAKENKFNSALLTKRHNEARIKEANLKKKLDDNVVYKKGENEKIIQNNCQNIYNLNINPMGKYNKILFYLNFIKIFNYF